jgi:hypothetical protein
MNQIKWRSDLSHRVQSSVRDLLDLPATVGDVSVCEVRRLKPA